MTKRKAQLQQKDFVQPSVGDRVVHPFHGIGQVIEIKHQELMEGFEHYCVIQIPSKRLILHIPMSKIKERGIRPTISQAELASVLDTLQRPPRPLPDEITKRQDQVREKLGTGQSLRLAEVVRDLTWHKDRAHLTKADADLLAQARELLVAEIATVANLDLTKAEKKINAALKVAIVSNPDD